MEKKHIQNAWQRVKYKANYKDITAAIETWMTIHWFRFLKKYMIGDMFLGPYMRLEKNNIKGGYMTRYRITAVIELDEDYAHKDQIEELRSDISMTIADYNCFCEIGKVEIEELSRGVKKRYD